MRVLLERNWCTTCLFALAKRFWRLHQGSVVIKVSLDAWVAIQCFSVGNGLKK